MYERWITALEGEAFCKNPEFGFTEEEIYECNAGIKEFMGPAMAALGQGIVELWVLTTLTKFSPIAFLGISMYTAKTNACQEFEHLLTIIVFKLISIHTKSSKFWQNKTKLLG